MTTASPCTYEITVEGHLDDRWSERLGGLDIVRHGDGTTILVERSRTRPSCTAFSRRCVTSAHTSSVYAPSRRMPAPVGSSLRQSHSTPPDPKAAHHPHDSNHTSTSTATVPLTHHVSTTFTYACAGRSACRTSLSRSSLSTVP